MMNFLIKAILISSVAFVVGCTGNSNNSTTSDGPQKQPLKAEEATAKPLGAKLDPICEMEKDDTWTEYTIYNQDTVWFCSEGCKKAFEARPEKYMKKG